MNYERVIPRDLFNEGNLLYCLGKLYIELEKIRKEDLLVHLDNEFNVVQLPEDGSITVTNVLVKIDGQHQEIWRPLNSRRKFPVYIRTGYEYTSIFEEDGTLTEEFIELIGD